MGNIYIDSNELKRKIEAFDEKKKELFILFDDFKDDCVKLKEVWQGNTGDDVSKNLKEFYESFDGVKNTLNKDQIFASSCAESYEELDKLISDSLDHNAELSALGGGN